MNNQQIAKIIEYFRINHNFHSPYTFLLDGNFLKILLERDMNLQQRLKPIIVGKTRTKITACTLEQLQILGRDFSIIYQQAKQLPVLKCKHAFTSADQCIIDHVTELESLIVCSQDNVLRRKLRGRHVGLMYFGPDQRITMEDVERHQLMNAKQRERQKFLPNSNEIGELEEYKKQQETMEKIRKRNQQYKLASLRGVELRYVKKKVLKGPNPLSVKKKKIKKPLPEKKSETVQLPEEKVQNEDISQVNVQPTEKKKRIRKRKNKNKPNEPLQQMQQQQA